MGSYTTPTNGKLRVLLIPFYATSHIQPFTDLAIRLAAANDAVEATVGVTPANVPIVESLLKDRGQHNVKIATYPFPTVDGLPKGVENLGQAATPEESLRIRVASISEPVMRPGHEALIRAQSPDAIVTDIIFVWNGRIAGELGVPSVTFCVIGVFSHLSMRHLKDQGGLGVHDLEVKNRALLGKWLFKLLSEDGIWQTLIRRKYVGEKAVSQVVWKPGDSHFWAGLMATKKYFFPHASFSIKNGSEIRFWEDRWLGQTTLREQYPDLYDMVRYKGDTLGKVLGTSPPNVSFRRTLLGPREAAWNALLLRLDSVQLLEGPDELRRLPTKNGYLPLHSHTPIMVGPSACGAPGVVLGGIVALGGGSQGAILPAWMVA